MSELITTLATEDAIAFGEMVIIHCGSRGRPHYTGWCTASTRHKVRLSAKTLDEAFDECRTKGLWLYQDHLKEREYKS